ncbi:DNA-binding protein [Eubacteriales bacterium OttesenSCG-928-M02]|nr:DNA-binding protein [Eubacteriales bacterium OttesenSCG-928-M02]
MEERVRVGLLVDFYGGLLTEHQRTALALYYMEDLSLSEIGEGMNMTRQGAWDAIKRGTATLERAEEQIGMVERFLAFSDAASILDERLKETGDEEARCMLEAAMAIWERE